MSPDSTSTPDPGEGGQAGHDDVETRRDGHRVRADAVTGPGVEEDTGTTPLGDPTGPVATGALDPYAGDPYAEDRAALRELDEGTVKDPVVAEDPSVVAVSPLEDEPESTRRDVADDHMEETTGTNEDEDPEVMALDRGQEASDLPLAAFDHGTTLAEERTGADLSSRLDEEEPDPALELDSSSGLTTGPREELATEAETRRPVLGEREVDGATLADVDPGVLATHSLDGQADDASGNDAGIALREEQGEARSRQGESTLPHGPA